MPKILTAREHWHKAFEYYFDGDRRRTIKEARLAMKLNPNYVRPHWIIGQVYLFTDPIDREAALKEFRELVRKDPRWPMGHATLAATLIQQGRKAEALQSIREVLRLDPKHLWARIENSKHLLERGEYRQAIAVLQAKVTPPTFCSRVDAYLLRAELLMITSYAKARAEWEYILTLDEAIPGQSRGSGRGAETLAGNEKALTSSGRTTLKSRTSLVGGFWELLEGFHAGPKTPTERRHSEHLLPNKDLKRV